MKVPPPIPYQHNLEELCYRFFHGQFKLFLSHFQVWRRQRGLLLST